jgi:hypothetical protein
MWSVRSRSAAAVLDGKVYALGGYLSDEQRAESSGETYDADIGAWIPLPAMHQGCPIIVFIILATSAN